MKTVVLSVGLLNLDHRGFEVPDYGAASQTLTLGLMVQWYASATHGELHCT
jgi:hypothetical protein